MRDLLAVASVILLALGLGGAAAYLSSESAPSAFEWAREAPVLSTITASFEQSRPTPRSRATGGCKYCSDISELADTFARRGGAARRHAEALQAAMSATADGQSARNPTTIAELNAARQAATRAESAAAILRDWSSRCSSEDFCRIKPQPLKAAACVSQEDAHTAAALLIAASVKKSAQTCASASCPAVDCRNSAALRSDVAAVSASLVSLGGPVRMTPGQMPPSQLPVGPSNVESELTRVGDEAVYVIKMAPFLLDSKAVDIKPGLQLPKLAPEMVNERAEAAAQLASVMVQSATIAPASRDLRPEAAWRLRSLAVNLASFGQESERANGGASSTGANWERLAQSLGGSLLDLARLRAMLDRARADAPVPGGGCEATVADAAQQMREALAMLDLCRMRSACSRGEDSRRDAYSTATHLNSTDAKAVQAAASAALNGLLPRAQTEAAALNVSDVGEREVIPVADGGQPRLIDMLRSQGVCRRAQDLREASAIAPAVARNVAQALTAPTTAPVVNAVAPQAVVAATADNIANAATPSVVASPFAPSTPGAELAQTMARYVGAAPRHKPQEVLASEPQTAEVRGVLVPQATPDSGVSFVGGPQQFGAPSLVEPAAEPAATPTAPAAPKQAKP